MATVVFEWAGTAIGGALGGPLGAQVGGLIGSALGGYVDNQIISSLTAPDPPRLDDLKVTVSTYGRSIPLLLGERMRVGGNVIWTTGLQEHKEGGKGSPANVAYTYSLSVAVALGEGDPRGQTIERIKKVWANGKVIYDEDATAFPILPAMSPVNGYTVNKTFQRHAVFDTISVYPGTFTQIVDPTIEAFEGAGEVPAYRGIAYVVIKNLSLADFGNRLPNLEFLVQARLGQSVGEACDLIIRRAGIPAGSAGVGALTQVLGGYPIGNRANATGALQPLAMAYFFDIAEVWGALNLQKRGTAVLGFIDDGDLGARESGNQRVEPIRWPRTNESQMPQLCAFGFADPERDYQANSQVAQRVAGSAEANVSFDCNLTLTVDQGAEIVDKLLWEAWTSQQTANTSVSDKHIQLQPGRTYLVGNALRRERVKVIRKVRGANGVHNVDLRRDRVANYNSTRPGVSAPVPPNELQLPGETILLLLDMPIVQESDDDSGFYSVVYGPEPGWRGGAIWRSTDDVTFTQETQQGNESILADVAIATPDGPTHVWDRTTVVEVTLRVTDDELSSVSEEEVLNGANGFWLGGEDGQLGEVIQFATATLTAPGVYELSDLLRGRLGTEHATGSHGVDEVFVLLNRNAMDRLDFGSSDWNKLRKFRATSAFQAVTDVASQDFTNTGEGKRPYSPVLVEGVRDGSDNVVITWKRRSRIPGPGLGNGALPLGESVEAYEVDVMDGPDVAAIYQLSTPEFDYTAAEQTADGLTPGDPIVGVIYQMSDSRGRGHGKPFDIA